MNARVVAMLGAALWAACEKPERPPSQVAALVVVSGHGQKGKVAQELSEPLVVRAVAADGSVVSRARLNWSAPMGQGNVSPVSSVTDERGLATARATLGPKAERNEFLAVSELTDVSTSFTALGLAGEVARVVKVQGDGANGDADRPLDQSLVARVEDPHGNVLEGVVVTWEVLEGRGAVSGLSAATAADGTARASVRLGPEPGTQLFRARAGEAEAIFSVRAAPTGLVYWDPPPGGKLRLVRNPASRRGTLVLDLVAGAPLRGFSAGFNLPIDGAGVVLAADGLIPGPGLEVGSGVRAAVAALPTQGPLAGVLVAGVSQKAAGAGAHAVDREIPVGTVLFSVRLELVDGSSPKVLVDGQHLGRRFVAGLRGRDGNDQVSTAEVRVGKLEIR